MSESNIYKEHYELQNAHIQLSQSIQNIYMSLHPLVAPEGVQLSLQEVLDLVVHQLSKVSGENAEETHEEVKPKKASKKSSE